MRLGERDRGPMALRAADCAERVLPYVEQECPEDDRLFRRVHEALRPGGVFVFDVLGPGQVPPGSATKGFRVGEDWAVLSEKEEDVERGTMTRRTVSFRKAGEHYRRDDEIHRVRLYGPEEISGLRRAGFEVGTTDAYGNCPLGKNHAAFVARRL